MNSSSTSRRLSWPMESSVRLALGLEDERKVGNEIMAFEMVMTSRAGPINEWGGVIVVAWVEVDG